MKYFYKRKYFIKMQSKKNPVIRLVNVSKIYKMGEVEVTALKNINLEVLDNEFIAIIGSSGSGKSTIMNIIGCLDRPSLGDVYLDGKNIRDLLESDLATHRGKNVGFVFQQYNLISTLSAFNNVKLPLDFQEYDEELADKRVDDIFKMVNLEDKKKNYPYQLSGGQQQRVSIARCLAVNPKIILADEPTGALDSKTGNQILSILVNLWKNEKKTIIMITHDLHIAEYASRIIELKDGEIIKDYKNLK